MLTAACVRSRYSMGCFPECDARVRLEVAPIVLRPYLTTFINMCWVIGQFFAAAVNKGSVGRTDEWAYRNSFRSRSKARSMPLH